MAFFNEFVDEYDYGPDYQTENYLLNNLNFDQNTNILSFELILITLKSKVSHKWQRAGVQYKRYCDLRESRKSITRFNKKIIIERFCNVEINEMKIIKDNFNLKKEILSSIGYKPKWFINKLKENKISNKIEKLNSELIDIDAEIAKVFKPIKLKDIPTSKICIFLMVLFAPFTLGMSFLSLVTKTRASKNKEINDENEANYEKEIDQIRKESNKKNKEIKSKISSLHLELKKTINEYQTLTNFIEDDNGWYPIKQLLLYPKKEELSNKKGVYIIWNKTLDKYYVGQSKDLFKRIFSGHFSYRDNCVKNYIFFNDWASGHDFYLKYYFFDTKDELDDQEKYYIDKYDAFRSGYNKTSGNK